MSIPDDAPKPRLCHLRKISTFNGYGFNLHAEKGKAGQFIGKVDEGSPAEMAGLREGDRIVEVNGTNIGNENHSQVVQRIKAVENEVKFLVVDAKADEYYREQKIVISGEMSYVLMLETPAEGPKAENGHDSDSRYKPRLCHMKVWSDFPGYGFNLHAEKGKSAQFIGKVDEGSPAEAAGLREGDRIVEVNGAVVLSETHGDVVTRIKSDPTQVTMLLVDPEAEEYFKEKGIQITSDLPSVVRIVCPDTNPHSAEAASAAKLSTTIIATATSGATDSSSEHTLRLCRIRTTPGGQGFGFNMQAEKGRPGQFISSVDPGSCAEKAGVKAGDRIVEVNGVNIEQDTHKQVVEKIKAIPNETTLLLVDREADRYFTEKPTALSSSLACVVKLENNVENGALNHADSESDSAIATPSEEPSSPAINNGSEQDQAAGNLYEEADPAVNVEPAAAQSVFDEKANQSSNGVESKKEDDNGVANVLPETDDKKEASVPEVAAFSVAVTEPVTKVRNEILAKFVKIQTPRAPTDQARFDSKPRKINSFLAPNL